MSEIAPIDTLPTEVLIRVFAHCDHETRLSVTGVCRNWRYTALETLTLWNSIDLSLPDVPSASVPPVLKRTILNTKRFPRPISAFADIFDMDQEKLQAVSEALKCLIPLTTFSDLVVLEPFNINDERGNISQPYINVNGAVSLEGALKLAWVHHTRDEGPPIRFTGPNPDAVKEKCSTSLSTPSLELASIRRKGDKDPETKPKLPKDIINDKCFTSLSPTLEGAGVTKREDWLIIHTHLNSVTGSLDSIAFANWGNLVGLQLALPGTYQYLPILENAPQLRILSLTFTNPPIIWEDQSFFPDQPFGFRDLCSIKLPLLDTLSINFQGESFENFPSSWNFLDSIEAPNLGGFSFSSSHMIDDPMADSEFCLFTDILGRRLRVVTDAVLRRHIPAYHALYKFIRRSGPRVNQGFRQIPGGFECVCH